jgi:hypothetical protein
LERQVLIKLPVTLVERNGDRSVYRTLGEAVDAVEPIDVLNGEYTIFDADGVALEFRVSRSKVRFLFGLFSTEVDCVEIVEAS